MLTGAIIIFGLGGLAILLMVATERVLEVYVKRHGHCETAGCKSLAKRHYEYLCTGCCVSMRLSTCWTHVSLNAECPNCKHDNVEVFTYKNQEFVNV